MTLFISTLNLIAIFGFAALIRRKQDRAIRPLFWPAFIVKLLAGMGLGFIYQHYYAAGDTFYFFDLAREQAQLFHIHPGSYFDFLWQDTNEEWKGAARSAFFVKIISIVAIVSQNGYWIASLWFSLISFLGSIYLVSCIVRFFPDAKWAAALAFLFFPSVVFWGSGIIKESIGLAALLLLSAMYLKAMMNQTPRPVEFVFGLVGFWIVWNLKYYWIAVFLPVVITSLVVHLSSIRLKIPSLLKLSYWIVLFVVLCYGVSLSHPNFYIERFLQVVIENHKAFVSVSDSADLIHYESLRADWLSVLANSPWALISGLFRPFLWEADNGLKVLVSLENLLILVLCIASVVRIRGIFQTQYTLVTLSAMVYVVLLCIFLALSTPNLGSLARYKVGFLPFLIFLISYKNPLIQYAFSLPLLKSLKKWFD